MAKSENLHRPYVPDMPHDYRRSYSRRDILKVGVATGLAVSCGGFAALTKYLLDTTGKKGVLLGGRAEAKEYKFPVTPVIDQRFLIADRYGGMETLLGVREAQASLKRGIAIHHSAPGHCEASNWVGAFNYFRDSYLGPYNMVIDPDGHVQYCVEAGMMTKHTVWDADHPDVYPGDHFAISIAGNFQDCGSLSTVQVDGLRTGMALAVHRLGVLAEVAGHRKFRATACPGDFISEDFLKQTLVEAQIMERQIGWLPSLADGIGAEQVKMQDIPVSYKEEIRRFKKRFISIAREEDIPPETLFVLWFKEGGGGKVNPDNKEGLFGLHDLVVQEEKLFTPGPVTDKEVVEQARLAAEFFKRKNSWITFHAKDETSLGNAYMAWNGNADCNWNPYPSYRGHPYVMNGYDTSHRNMEARSSDPQDPCKELKIIGALPAHLRVREVLGEEVF